MAGTLSENLFEQYCTDNNVPYMRIAESTTKQPDYRINFNILHVITEIKQVDPNRDDKERIKEFEETGMTIGNQTPGARVRGKISSGAGQIAKLARGKHPGLLVLYNNLPACISDPLDPYHIRVAMEGFDTIVLSLPSDYQTPTFVGKKSGPKKKTTPTVNTSISSVAVLRRTKTGLFLDVYHNRHAKLPLLFGLMKKYTNCEEYVLVKQGHNKFSEWRRVIRTPTLFDEYIFYFKHYICTLITKLKN